MAFWGSLLDLSWWGVRKFCGTAYWIVWGTPETPEQKNIRETKQRLEDIEKKIEQMWALQTHMVEIDTEDPNLTSSLVILEESGDIETFASSKQIRSKEKK